jgi:phospholipase C
LLATALANAVPPTFQHIIIVIQENRTPDNLFGGNTSFELGLDLQRYPNAQPWCLGACFSPGHKHESWKTMWNHGGPNWNNGAGACNIQVHNHCFDHGLTYCNGVGVAMQPFPACPQETYVDKDYDNAVVQPYYEIAKRYGFANYFFQTNQGPSFPAHQFLLGGTSAPSGTPVPGTNYQYFAADNPFDDTRVGCNAPNTIHVKLTDVSGNVDTLAPVRPCFDHETLASLLNHNSISWKYYAPSMTGWETSLWTAPNAISSLCRPTTSGHCTSSDWTSNVFSGPKQVLKDMGVDNNPCQLRQVSWVVPNGKWSDHPGLKNGTYSDEIEKGPAWVASIVNTLGTSPCVEPRDGLPYWQDTVIFVVWDDWGGFWDHVDPLTALPVLLYNDQCSVWGCGDVYGFRVPFLVVSAYMAAGQGQQGYVSGDTRTPGGGEVAPYIHDFGSILGFVENNFNLGIGNINSQNQYPFADGFAPERTGNPNAIPLADFFCSAPCGPQEFQQIPVAAGTWQAINFVQDNSAGTDPDDDAADND